MISVVLSLLCTLLFLLGSYYFETRALRNTISFHSVLSMIVIAISSWAVFIIIFSYLFKGPGFYGPAQSWLAVRTITLLALILGFVIGTINGIMLLITPFIKYFRKKEENTDYKILPWLSFIEFGVAIFFYIYFDFAPSV
jgi:hypothetical protein